MKTRQKYIDGKITHREYYAQFVTEEDKKMVKRNFGKRITESKDEHLNNIPLQLWDLLAGGYETQYKGVELRKAGDNISLAGAVCILKEAARQIKEET